MASIERCKAKIGDKIVCVLNFPPGSLVERKTEMAAILSTQQAVDYANAELIPSGRWKVVNGEH